MAMHAKDVLGRSGEQAAADYLESCGLRILDRNWRCAVGEIDIVAVDRRTLVVVEVKSRTGTRCGSPLEAVTRAKRARLRRLAVQWLNAHGIRFDQVYASDSPCLPSRTALSTGSFGLRGHAGAYDSP